MDFGALTWPTMGKIFTTNSTTTAANSNEWNTTEISNGKPVKSAKSTKKKKKKKTKKTVIKQRSNDELIEFYKKDRRFIAMPTEKEEEEDKEEEENKDNNTTTVRLMTYNILADGRRYGLSDHHNYCPKQYRTWNYRFQSILCQLEAYKPDIVCIQESTPSSWKNKMKEPLNKIGYIGIHAAREQYEAKFAGLSQSDCVIWKQDKFTLIKHKILRLKEFIKKPDKESEKYINYDINYDKWLGSDKSMFRSFCSSCNDIIIILHLKCNNTNKQFIVCSSHFFWDPTNPEIKASQSMIFNVELERLLKTDKEWKWNMDKEEKQSECDINQIPIIFGVDSNSLPFKTDKDIYDPDLPPNGARSGVYELMINGKLSKDHKDHPFCRINEREKRYQKVFSGSAGNVKMSQKEVEYVGDLIDWNINIKWKSVYSSINKRNKFKEPIFTNRIPSFCDTLDYIFLSNKCGIKAFLEMPWQKELKYHMLLKDDDDNKWIEMELMKEKIICNNFPFLPNEYHPSDHLPLCADIIIY